MPSPAPDTIVRGAHLSKNATGGAASVVVVHANDTDVWASPLFDTPNRELSMVGRWISPDPAGMAAANPASPQSWNRYAYVLNGPLNSVDPSGLHSINDCGGCTDDNFGNPGAVTYIVNGMQVSSIVAQNILGIGAGNNSFTNSSFFFNAQAAMDAPGWSQQDGNTWVHTGDSFVPNSPAGCENCLGTLVPNWVNLGTLGSGIFAGTFYPGQNGSQWANKNGAEWFMKKGPSNPKTIPGPPENPDLGGRDWEAIDALEKAAHAILLMFERGEIQFMFVVMPAQELCSVQHTCGGSGDI